MVLSVWHIKKLIRKRFKSKSYSILVLSRISHEYPLVIHGYLLDIQLVGIREARAIPESPSGDGTVFWLVRSHCC